MAATRCPSCKSLCSSSATACKKCGAAIAQIPAASAPIIKEEPARICPDCAETTKGARCEFCGCLLPRRTAAEKRRCPECTEATENRICEHCGYRFGQLSDADKKKLDERVAREAVADVLGHGILGNVIGDAIRPPSIASDYFARRAARKR
jgi:hypothetical protein